MTGKKKEIIRENKKLKEKIRDLKQTLTAIHKGEVDAIRVDSDDGEKIFTLTSAETPYRILIEQMNEGAAILSQGGIVLYCNQRLADLLGENMETITGTEFYKFMNAKDRKNYKKLFQQGLEDRVQDDFKFYHHQNPASYKHLLLSIKPFEKEVTGADPLSIDKDHLCLIATDITDYKDLENQLYEYQEKLEEKVAERTRELKEVNRELEKSQRAALNLMEDAIQMSERLKINEQRLVEAQQIAKMGDLTYNIQTGEIELSDALYDLLKLERSEKLNYKKFISEFHHPEDREVVNKWLTDNIDADTENLSPLEYRVIRKDEETIYVRSIGVIKSENSEPLELFLTIQDITERKKIEQEREQLNQKLKTKNKELEQLLYATSHDLRSPLVNIQGFTKELKAGLKDLKSIVKNHEIPEPVKEKCEFIFKRDIAESFHYISSSSTKMDNLLTGLLSLSRLGRQKLNITKLDANALVKDVISNYEYEIKEKDIELTIDELPGCYGDELQINQVFLNLIGNAVKYLDPDRPGRIKVFGEKRNGQVHYYVEDNGIGIPQQQKKRIFDLFHQNNPQKSGIGLGLNIVKQIMEKHNGKIEFESKANQGATFKITLPIPHPDTE